MQGWSRLFRGLIIMLISALTLIVMQAIIAEKDDAIKRLACLSIAHRYTVRMFAGVDDDKVGTAQ
jgi:hypothetical protein